MKKNGLDVAQQCNEIFYHEKCLKIFETVSKLYTR